MNAHLQQESQNAGLRWPGQPWPELKAEMERAGHNDPAKWRDVRTFGMVYPGGPEVDRVIREAYQMFFVENGRHGAAFTSISRFERDIVAMTASLFGAQAPIGNVLSGGTECALVAMKTVRDEARAKRGIENPEVILPATVYPVYTMAAHYLGVKVVPVDVDANYRVDLEELKRAINDRTIMVVGSAPNWSYGVIDPIAEIGAIAMAAGIHLHVDACVGGYQIPFIRRLGHSATNFDFTIPGVCSITADLHKFGYSAQGSAILLYRDQNTYSYQGFHYATAPFETWSNAAMLTSRPAGAVAASWAVMRFLGEDGYLKLTSDLMKATIRLRDGICAIPGLTILGDPPTSVFAYTSKRPGPDINAIANALTEKGWFIRHRQDIPIHVVLTPPHVAVIDRYLDDLRQASRQEA